jgi:translation initiation factor IF-1
VDQVCDTVFVGEKFVSIGLSEGTTGEQMGERRQGVIERQLPRRLFKIRCEDGQLITASIGRLAQRVNVSFLPGDGVTVEISPFDPNRGRIVGKQEG